VVERALIVPPQGRIGPLTDAERKRIIDASPVKGQYEKLVDRESAYEILKERATKLQEAAAKEQGGGLLDSLLGGGASGSGRRREGMAEAMAKSAARAVGSQIGRQIVRGVLGSLLGGRR
jgi:DNA helicase HerA-like ATPase